MGAHDFKLNKVPRFVRKSVTNNVSLSAAPKLALVPASSYVNWLYLNYCAKFRKDRKRSRWGFMTSNITRCLFLLGNQGISMF